MARSKSDTCCPRCGYDLRGDCERWTEACPLDGRCTECGLDFCWSDLFNRDRAPPPWSTEYVSRWRIPRAVISGSVRMLRPRRFWKALPMERPVHSGRLAVHVLVIALLPWVVAETFRTVLAAILIFKIGYATTPPTSGSLPQALAIHLLMPWAPIRPGGDVAGGPASFLTPVWPTPLELRHALSMPSSPYGGGNTVIQMEAGLWVFRSVRSVSPLVRLPKTVEFTMSSNGLPASAILRSEFQRLVRGQFRHSQTPFLMTAFAALAMPLAFVCLPVSLRRAKVRPAHLYRIAAYSVAIPALLPLAESLFVYGRMFLGGSTISATPFDSRMNCLILLAVLLALLVTWWGYAIRYSLRLPTPLAICAAISTIVLLTTGLVFVFPLAEMLI